MSSDSSWYLYIARCNDNTLYTGVTTDVRRRIKEHNEGTGAKYTRGRGPIQLLFSEEYSNRSTAQIAESKIKKLKRKEKEEYISETLLEKMNGSW